MTTRMSVQPPISGLSGTDLEQDGDINYQEIEDLTFLSTKTDKAVSTILHKRINLNLNYTKIGARLLISLNPYQNISQHTDSVLNSYLVDQKIRVDQGKAEPLNSPHIYQLAQVVYFHLRRSGIDQSVVFNGDSGSGKTFCFEQFVTYLGASRKKSNKETRLYENAQNALTLFQSFGHCSINGNRDSSRVGKYLEIQFDKLGRTVGLKFLDYLLEKERVTKANARPNQSNFLVFYQMLAGLNHDEKSHFQLHDVSGYNYLHNTQAPSGESELEQQFGDLKTALKGLGFNRKYQSQIFQLLAAILHLGNIVFINHGNHSSEPAIIKNHETLDIAADFLGLLPSTLEGLLTYKTQMIKKEMCTIFLDASDAAIQRDDLVKCLYSLLFSWMIEHVNSRLCKEGQLNFIGLLDLPGFQARQGSLSFEDFCVNYANERLYNYLCFQVFEASNAAYEEDGVTIPILDFDSNHDTVQLLGKPGSGIVSIIDKLANKPKGPANDQALMQALAKNHSNNSKFLLDRVNSQFTISHYSQSVSYSVSGFMEANRASIGADFVLTFRGTPEAPIGNHFVAGLFTSEAIATETNAKLGGVIIAAQQPNIPLRKPSMKRERLSKDADKKDKPQGAMAQFQVGLDELFDTFDNTEAWFVICLNTNPLFLPKKADHDTILNQVEKYSLANMAIRKEVEYTVCYQHDEFVTRYQMVLGAMGIDVNLSPMDVLLSARENFGWGPEHMALGHRFTYLCDGVWRDLEENLKVTEKDGYKPQLGVYAEDNQSYYSDEDQLHDDKVSYFGQESKFSASQDGDLFVTKNENLKLENEEDEEDMTEPKTKIRKTWICFTWAMTWWVPSSFLSCCGRMKLKEVKMAWREKVTLCLIIFFMCAAVVTFIVGINPLICPTRNIFSSYELDSYNTPSKPLVSIYGQIFDLRGLSTHYGTQQTQLIKVYAGKDVSFMFPQQISSLCMKYDGTSIDETVALQNTTLGAQDKNAQYHDHRYYRGSDYYQPDWFQNAMQRMKITMKAGDLATDPTSLQKKAQTGYFWFSLNERVYDLNSYVVGSVYTLTQTGQSPPSTPGYSFMDPNFIDLVRLGSGKDITLAFDKLYASDPATKAITTQCLNNVFYSGVIDDRMSFKCVFAQYILLALSVFLFLVLFVKFLASLQLGSRPEPEDHDRFVILTVPCYTEGEESLKKTIDSLAVLKYDDKRKLLFIVADGMVMGGGNDLPTPRIVLDILGTESNEPEPLSFHSLGEGLKQHNMGKVYTGLYECYGHVVPYLVVVKVGRPTERAKPGNRGKRDSQLILMRFFNKVHYDYPMVPMELEMYHQIKNVIGVDPHFYEYVLMVDADTVVMPDSLNRLVSAMLHDTKIMGLCGETALSNEKETWATMIQVYEYFISHHLAKAFESLFGSVTCLPGCFCMYRLRAPTGQPLLVNNVILNEYSENRVDTLHKKNLLHLGEDRYLTTLMLKHFPFNKMTFTPDAMCLTSAPDTWDVLLSQRRRWINSTVHNLLELVFLPRLCGFCCFSMRFVVFLDLLSTVIAPATLGYLAYLIYRLITDSSSIPILSLCFILAPYVLQMIVFILRRQWQHIGWMIVYLLALPVFAFFIPIYAFWHFDDFSWGNTRIVMGENGKRKKVVVATGAEDGKFDIKSIPTKKWSEYEEELWEAGTEHSHDSKGSNFQRRPNQHNMTQSMVYAPDQAFLGATPSVGMINNLGPRGSQVMVNQGMINPYPASASRPGSRLNLNQPSQTDFYAYPNPPPAMSMYSTNQAPAYQMPPTNQMAYPYTSASRSASAIFDPRGGAESPRPLLSNDNEYSEQLDLDIFMEVKRILANSDLMSVTKKQVRDQLSHAFGRDMTNHKDYINQCIEKVLAGQA